MELVQRLTNRLTHAREFSLMLLQDFSTDEDWTFQLHDGGNHALWFLGHIATTDNFMITLVDPNHSNVPKGYPALFGIGSTPSPEISDYPSIEEVKSYCQERRNTLLAILARLTDDDLATETPDGAPEFMPDFASVFETAIWHEGLHTGQLSMLRRVRGFAPVV